MLSLLHHATRIGLAGIFLWAAIAKLSDMASFAENLAGFGLVPDPLVEPAAWAVCLVELVLGLALAANVSGALTLLTGLLCAFIATLLYGIVLGLDIDCGCFGPGYHVGLKTQLAVDLGLLLGCGFVYWSGQKCSIKTFNPVSAVRKITRPTPPDGEA